MKKILCNTSFLCFIILCLFPLQLIAEDKGSFSEAELDQIMAPIALYPDSLLSQILMASTYPANVAEAVKWSKANPDQKGDAAVTAVQDQSWDPSVMSLTAFPQVLEMMGKEPDWVQNLGDAFLDNPDRIMDTAQKLRKKAKDEGNLKTTEQQVVKEEQVEVEPQAITQQQSVVIEEAPATTTETVIIIEPADPKVVYVPVYNPTVVYGSWWWPHYTPYYYHPIGYNPIMAGIGFGIGVGITRSLWGGCRWGRGRGDVNINVNKYNNINVGNKINSNNRSTNWKHNSKNRQGVPYRDKNSRQKYNKKQSGIDSRKNHRGRDTNNAKRNSERQRAQNTLKNRGADPIAGRKELSGKGGDRVRKETNKINRQKQNHSKPQSLGNNRKANNNRVGNNNNRVGNSNNRVGNSNNRVGNSNNRIGNNSNRAKTTKPQRSPKTNSMSQNRNRSSALSGVRNSGRTSQNINRGSRSHSSSRGGGGHRGGGGGARGGGARGGR